MIRAAFYAPMKPPDDPVPSGDRAVARALLAALAHGDVAAQVVSDFRSRDGKGLPDAQEALMAVAKEEVERLIPTGRAAEWKVWITYHSYYKAPDLIGPAVSRALKIPYVQVEATRARKRLTGPWARFAQAAEDATDAARAVLYLTRRDGEALHAYRHGDQLLEHLPPFLATPHLPPETTRENVLLSVGMMRAGDKLASYRLIAESLHALDRQDWQLSIAGDGPARTEVEALMAPFGNRIKWLGQLDPYGLHMAYRTSSILFWPGVNEAFGMTYLEAQAAGITVLAQDRPGVRDVLFPGAAYPDPVSGAEALAARLDMLIANPKLVMHLGQDARDYVSRHHLMGTASARLKETLAEVLS